MKIIVKGGKAMKINWIRIKGFRNYVDEQIHFSKKSLIIGANDVGKSNLIYALRILFDRTISERDLELTDSDYNAYAESADIEITVEIDDIVEDCLKSAFSGDIKDGKTYIRYTNSKEGSYAFWGGFSEEVLEEKATRYYIRRLNMERVDTNRDLFQFLKREKGKLLETAKIQLDELKIQKDKKAILTVQKSLDRINARINSLNYIKNSLKSVNESLGMLSAHNDDQEVRFVAGNSDATKLLDNLELSYSTGETPLCVGGDGRNNQIFIATWIAKQNLQKAPDHVTFYAIEEPEAHLHPHQQRKLAQFLVDSLNEQIFITTHSSQIAASFTPEHIVRLYTKEKISYAAKGGCSKNVKLSFDDFGYRLNAISAEVFFADGVLLVEGPSEVLFYTYLSQNIGIDLDYLNITILSVDGVGFKPYIKICEALEIPYVVRTDNDVFSKKKKVEGKKVKKTVNYYAGVSRLVGIYKEVISSNCEDEINTYWSENGSMNEWKSTVDIPDEAKELNSQIRTMMDRYNLFLAKNNLEEDLVDSELYSVLKGFYGCRTRDSLVKKMQERKAENMLAFLKEKGGKISILSEDEISYPLKRIAQLVEREVHHNASN